MQKILEKIIKNNWEGAYYNTQYNELPWERNKPENELIRLIKEKKIKGKVLDLGCGAGTQSIYLDKNGFKVTGLDISENAIKIAKQRANKEKVKINFIVGNAFDLKFKDKTFNFIFDRGCFHHIPIPYRNNFVRGIYRVLMNKGKYHLMCFSNTNKWFQENLFSLKKINKYFGKYFDIIEEREIMHKQPDGFKVYLRSVLMSKK